MPVRCCVPGCPFGYNDIKNKATVTVFSVPKDEKRLALWQSKIQPPDRPMRPGDVVCDRHFEEHMIQRHFIHFIRGEEVRIPRDRVKLLANAVPTIFPELSTNNPMNCKSNLYVNGERLDALLTLSQVPNGWGRTVSPNGEYVLWSYCDGDVAVALVQVRWQKGVDRLEVLVRGVDVTHYCRALDSYRPGPAGLTSLLTALSQEKLCSGILVDDFVGHVTAMSGKTKLSKAFLTSINIVSGRLYSRNCAGFSSSICSQCRYWRRFAQQTCWT